MGCASAKHVSTVQNEEETQKGKNYQNGDVFGDEYRIKPVEEVKYMKNGGEDDQKIAARNQENLEKSASSNARLKSNKEIPGLVHQPRANMHISESQQEFFRMLDEKIEKIDKDILDVMENPRNAKPFKYSNDVTGLLRLMRNMDGHKDKRVSNKIGDYAEYFLKFFPKLTIYVYNSLHQNPTYSHFADFQDPSL